MGLFVAIVFFFLINYYLCTLLHEWGHGFTAWLFGVKEAFFDIHYGGWLFLDTHEHVPYDQLNGTTAALIAVSGLLVTLVLFLLSLALMNRIQKHPLAYLFFYSTALVNLIPLVQYFPIQTFSSGGDVGHFIKGLQISPWWVFFPGLLFTSFALYQMLAKALPKAYALLPIRSLWGRNLFLLYTLSVIFLFIHIQGYNPFTAPHIPLSCRILGIIAIFLVPVLFILCYPSRAWVCKAVEIYSTH